MRTLDQFTVGEKSGRFGRYEMTHEEILEFAGRYDPQPFHLDDAAAAANPIFGKLVSSGWHTASVTMRLIVDNSAQYGGHALAGAGVEDLRWVRPVYPGDVLSAEQEVVDVRPSLSRHATGIVTQRTTTFNQNDEPVMMMVSRIVVPTQNTVR